MKSIIMTAAFSTLMLASGAFALDVASFSGKYRAAFGDCDTSTTMEISYDKKIRELTLVTTNSKTKKSTTDKLNASPYTTYFMNKKTAQLEVTNVVAEELKGENSGENEKSISRQTNFISFDDTGKGEAVYFDILTLTLTGGDKKLIYNAVDGDGENDPHEYICEFARI